MDYTIIWYPEATENLVLIAEYISRDSGFYARAVVLKIIKDVRSIPDHP